MEFASDRARRERRQQRPKRTPVWRERRNERIRSDDESLVETTNAQRRRYYRSYQPTKVNQVVVDAAKWASNKLVDEYAAGEHDGNTVYHVDDDVWNRYIGEREYDSNLVGAAREVHTELAEIWGLAPTFHSAIVSKGVNND